MSKSSTPKPTESELNILQVLWLKGPSSVRLVNDILSENKDIGYTTTLKLMQIMTEKGLVIRDTSTRSHIYSANVSEDVTKNKLLGGFLESTFQGSAGSLVMQALGNHKTSPEELEKIKSLIKEIEKSNDGTNQ